MSNNGIYGITGNLFGGDYSLEINIIANEYTLSKYLMKGESN